MMKKMTVCLLAAVLLVGCKGDTEKTEEEKEFDEPEAYACRVMDYYDYTQPVPWSEAIDDSYFDDVLFAGDSRMGAMYLWGDIHNADVEYVTSLNLWLIDSMKLDNHADDKTMYDALNETKKNNIYLLFGINEIRSNEEYFESWAFEQYQSILTMLRENNPDSNVYIMSTYHPRSISGLPEPALTDAYNRSVHTILTSGCIVVSVTAIVGYAFSDPSVRQIVHTISKGAACAVVLILFVLPGLLTALDRLVVRRR